MVDLLPLDPAADTRISDKSRVAYLTGTSYSGSTLMALLMDSHPDIASVGETGLHRAARRRRTESRFPCSCGRLLVECPFWLAVFDRLRDRGVACGPIPWPDGYKYLNPVLNKLLGRYSATPAIHGLQSLALSAFPSHRRKIAAANERAVALVETVLDLTGKHVFFDASKSLTRLSHLLRTSAFDLRIVRLVRDVRGFSSSFKRHKDRPAAEAARHWRHFHRTLDSLLRGFPEDRVFVLRYEDLCREPLEWHGRLCEFLGVAPVAPPDSIVPAAHHVIGNKMRLADQIAIRLDERWKGALSPAEVSGVLALAGATNRRFGYAA